MLVPTFLAALTLCFTDFTLSNYLKGMAAHSGRLLGRGDGSYISYYVFNPNLPFMFVFVALLAIWLITLARKPHIVEFWPAATLFVCFIYLTAFAAPPMVYNLAWLIPLVLFELSTEESKSRAPIALVSALAIVFSLSAALFAAGKIANIRNGVPAERLIEAIQTLPNKPILLRNSTPLAVIAALQPEIGMTSFSAAPEQARIRIAPQALSRRNAPEVTLDECLLVNAFHTNDESSRGAILNIFRQDWAFAIIALKPCERP